MSAHFQQRIQSLYYEVEGISLYTTLAPRCNLSNFREKTTWLAGLKRS